MSPGESRFVTARILYLPLKRVRCPVCKGKGGPLNALAALFPCEDCVGTGYVPERTARRIESEIRKGER